MSSTKTKKLMQFIDDNSVESVKSLGEDIKSGFADDLVRETGRALWEQMLGKTPKDAEKGSSRGDLSEGAELRLRDLKAKTEEAKVRVEAGINYAAEVIHGEKRERHEDSQELRVRMEEIAIELRQLMNTSQELQAQFKDVAVAEIPENPGKYHLSFLEWVLDTIRQARIKVEDSGAWLNAFYSKKAKRGYWKMFKKHGTTFGLSGERVVSTQTG